MKSCFVTLTLCACLTWAAADVSHLPSSSYLPPPKPEQVEHMTIEQHELRELPEQVDYMHENEEGVMELAPSSQLTPPAMPEGEQMLSGRYLPPPEPTMPEQELAPMPSARYLPPAPVPVAMQEAEQQRVEPEPEQEQPMQQLPEMMPTLSMEFVPPVEPQPQAAPAMQYLPPVQQPQYTYQQYQEQLQQQQQQQQEQPQDMPYILDVQQPTAPSDAESAAYEPEPAHELRSDGYHYKQASEEQRLRH
ncbi:putative uncharacterized protein DDB_G0294196 isoform X1 [Drosophila sulfurigaster albostrigata]|uniref:putative uncharacterized protein DDB_G0294196 isoform X1 n=2 Tax=Drosophila sulfurigaster albostrigata TaxID=89887 RepID=UPI002D218CEA|nr:putative uncharacterized protein DDB_G0294196 isoform X1 [Drosophila sulfurigaster albostrigata]